jgi:uncharacterized protein YcfJ
MKTTMLVSLAALTALSACAAPPLGPTVAVMPGPNKPFDVFQTDQAVCRQFSEQQVGGPEAANQTGTNQALTGAAVGTLLGAGLGAALGAASGNAGAGAAIGAGAGAVGGTAVGASNAQNTHYSLQQRYDIAYQQCMYSRGNQVPGYAAGPAPYPAPGYAPPPPGYAPPPPPPPPGYR